MKIETLIESGKLQRRVARLAEQIAADCIGTELVLVGLLNGGFMFAADLSRQLHRRGISLVMDFMMVASYGDGMCSSGKVRLLRDITVPIRDRYVLLLDDILDTGRTLEYSLRHLRKRRPASLKSCVLLDKPERRVTPAAADYTGFQVPDRFIVGYGLDYAGRYRELPCLAAVIRV